MGKRKRNRKRHLTNINTSAAELPNAVSVGNMCQPIAKRPTIIRPDFAMSSSSHLPQPIQVFPNSVIPSRFSLNSVPRKWLSPIPFWHAKFVFPPVRASLPVAIVPPLRGVPVASRAANADPILFNFTPFPPKSSITQTLTEETRFPVQDSNTRKLQLASSQGSDLNVDVRACGTEDCTIVNVSSDLDPVTVQPTAHQVTEPLVNAGGSDSASKKETPNEVDDVIYLYRVEPQEGKLIEVVDLDEDSKEISCDRNLFLSSRNPGSCKETEMKQGLSKTSSDSEEVLEIYSSISVLGEKSKDPVLPLHTGKKRKREENNDTLCSVCHKHYEGVRKDDNLLFISKCGHIFCINCLRNLVPYKCTECNAGISNLCKVIF